MIHVIEDQWLHTLPFYAKPAYPVEQVEGHALGVGTMSTVHTPAGQAALESFTRAATGGEESAYPDRAAIVASDMEGADEALWHYLHEGRATVVVDSSGAELMVMPAQVSRVHRYLNELRRRIAVEVYIRRERPAAPATVAVHADIGRHAIGEIREAVPV